MCTYLNAVAMQNLYKPCEATVLTHKWTEYAHGYETTATEQTVLSATVRI